MQELNLTDIKKAWFLGIGGIGMSAIARYFHSLGIEVGGYDKTPSELTDELRHEGMYLTFDDNIDSIPLSFLSNSEATLFIFTPAIPKDHPQLKYIQNTGLPLMKRSEVLGLISRNSFCIAVAGTHGKTTTSTLIAHILSYCNVNFTAFLGGISANYKTNYLHKTDGTDLFENMVVVEADEFDRSFHRLSPNVAVITAIDPDHLDIYETESAFYHAFTTFAGKLKTGGTLVRNSKTNVQTPPGIENLTYSSTDKSAQFRCEFSGFRNGYFTFNYHSSFNTGEVIAERDLANISSGLPGFHNIENATAAIAVCMDILHLEAYDVKDAVKSFKGVKRRFEYVVRNENYTVIDDYAHHPEEIRAIIHSVKALHTDKKITVIFQPHLFTRTRDFLSGFAESLSMADALILMEIYPAREIPIPGITSELLKSKITSIPVEILTPEKIFAAVKTNKPELLLILGAGDIDRIVPEIKDIYGHF